MSQATIEKTKEEVKAPQFEDDDYCTVIHRNWNAFDQRTRQPLIRADQETYLDRITFVGGVARNVPYEIAKKWVKIGLISKEHIFANNAQAEDFAKATGREAMTTQTLAGAIASLSPEKATAILGEEAAKEFAKSLLRLISTREKAQENAE